MIHIPNQTGDISDTDVSTRSLEKFQRDATILFVDDEIYLAEVGREMLEDYGYCVDIMTSSRQAFEWFEKNRDRYHLLITDYIMPEMTGVQLVEKIHSLRPDLPVIMCSGIDLPSEIFQTVCITKVLSKPFDMEKLVKTVQEVLHKSRG